jgi:hypothetical protein
MHGMWEFTGVAGHRALSAGILLIAGGGLALYQMTSLVLGPGGSRQLHVSLTVPSADPDERAESWGNNPALGMVVALAPSVTAPGQVLSRLAEPRATAVSRPAPIVATPPTLPVPAEAATRPGQGHPQPPKDHETD